MKKPDFENSFSFSGSISGIRKEKKAWHIMLQQIVVGRLPTDYKLVVPINSLPSTLLEESFPYTVGDNVLIQDSQVYIKDSELRLRINEFSQIKPCLEAGLVNTLTFSGEVSDVKEESTFYLVKLKQTVAGYFETSLEVLMLKPLDSIPKVGDIGYIKDALFYEKNGAYRAKTERDSQYKILYSPDIVMSLGTVEAKEKFA